MEQNNTLHSLFTKMIQLKKKVADINRKKSAEEQAKLVSKVDNKLDRLANILKDIKEHQFNINGKQNKIICTVQDKSLLSDNSIQLSHTQHEKFIYMINSKVMLDKLINSLQIHTDKCEDLHTIINQFKEIHTSAHNDFIESLCEFRSTKGLLNNVKELKEIEWKNSSMEAKNSSDSDLGCYPNDSGSSNALEKVMPQFTSSPITFACGKK